MISILIVDDNSQKIAAIKEVLLEYVEIPKTNIKISVDANNARLQVDTDKFDLLILDLVIPNEFGEEESPENGIDFLNELSSDPNKFRPFHIIGISGYSEYIDKYSSEFKKNLWYLIEYREDEEEWKNVLRSKIEYLINSKNELKKIDDIEYNFDVAIITAIYKELDKVLKLNYSWKEYKANSDNTIYYIGQTRKDEQILKIVAACCPQMGMCASSTLTMKLIRNFKPKYVMMSGICAGIKGEVELGDVLIADQVWDGSSGKIKNDGDNGALFQPDPKFKILDEGIKEKLLPITSRRKYLDEIRNEYPGSPPSHILNAYIGPMASVPAVIQSEGEIEKIKNVSRKLIGIEMESYGVFYSSDHGIKPKPKVISIKSVCDFANEEKNDSFQDYAAYTSAAFIDKMINNELEY
ncbi:hypothetical protein [Flavobacterium sp. TBRC 19031]|uniref:phosphorylase family protein n=1 Tax=Flavobacterium mekongense TaxID=3379707 RepID=UPI00399BF8C5